MLTTNHQIENLPRGAASPLPACSTPRCDRRPKRGCLHCQPCIDDLHEGRTVIARGADEFLPFTPEMERHNSVGPCPVMTKGDCAIGESRDFSARNHDRFNPWTGDPARRTPPRPMN